MTIKKRKTSCRFLLVIILLYTFWVQSQEKAVDTSNNNLNATLSNAKKIRYQNPEKALIVLQEVHDQALVYGDTLLAINALLEMPYIYGQQVNYAKSYDTLWHALFLADDIGNEVLRAKIYGYLGRLSSFFKRKDEAFNYLNTSLKIKKNLVENGILPNSSLVEDYYLICATYRELDDPKMANIYLDSCFTVFNTGRVSQLNKQYLDFEKAFILSKEDKNNEALLIMQNIEPWFKENRPSYLVLVYTYWGDILSSLGRSKEGEQKYIEALEISSKYNSHIDFSPLIYERLSCLYLDKGNFEKAYENLNMAKVLDAQFFDSRSEINRPLLEIKDQFRLEQERQLKIIQQQRLEQLEQADKISFLQRTILLVGIIFLIIVGLIYVKYLRSKHKAEKELIRRNKELEIKKAKELLELKNKELATSALQLVEKDELFGELKDKIKGNQGKVDEKELNSFIRSISVSSVSNWQEFKLRFTDVNESFYQNLTANYPQLTQSDHRICALIKLNLSSKDMARLLGISVESVHTTRYRLRKKMGLPRSANLEDFIAEL
ncbi:DNA-binding transcriptional regulator, CsgD family [Arenibacter palladensis]|uniref:DNA-binding transcriptional regulator, CsgD family n=1 Tax=Arenibacter palladensis TaxID=237373 RepID=A0A1M5EZH6_9FLAO|nr:hypothetical protein [Arenibacter palladensis]SHF84371.1 DNA-binding transcriptional regulator, CsgD family [Arenibacter palladensis]